MNLKFSSQKLSHRITSLAAIIIMIVSLFSPMTVRRAYALDIPVPLYPEYGLETTVVNYPPLGIPNFVWSEVTGATMYRIQVDGDIGFTAPIELDITTPLARYTPNTITSSRFADGQWYWRVRVEQPAPVGTWSDIFMFTKTWAAFDNKPSLTSPADGEYLAFFDDPAFTWGYVSGAAKYRFQIAVTPDGFNSPLYSVDTLANRHQPPSKYANGTYYWRVVPLDPANHLGTPSDVRSFYLAYGTSAFGQVPTLLEPANNSEPVFTPTFRWTAVVGAEKYRLEYTSDQTCDFSVGTAVETRQTSYTPTNTFPNDAQYCWRVRAHSGASTGEWSETWYFQKRWDIQPQLLTPTDLYQMGLYPLYSWAPVPGANRYRIEIDLDPSFNPIYETGYVGNPFYTPNNYIGTQHYWWRVTPIDYSNNAGLTSEVFEYQSFYTSTAPILVYPLDYYLPNDPIYYGSYVLNPVEDRTVAFPVFIWHRVHEPTPFGGILPAAYHIQVDTTPYFNAPVWEADTENTSATPTVADPFTPTPGQNYYWRVCPLASLGGNCLVSPGNGITLWSQIWRTRFDSSLALPPTAGPAPELLRPVHGQEVVEATPLMEWYPLQNATQYKVQISSDPSFATYETEDFVTNPVYSPDYSLAQRSLNRTDYGTFYWRVSGYVSGSWGSWSPVWRFQIASQSEWRLSRVLGDAQNQLIIGDDPAGDAALNYDLTTLYASQARDYWYLGFHANMDASNMTYVIYLDLDHVDGSGGSTPPERSYNVTTIPAHQPEYVIYVDQVSGSIIPQNVWIFKWNVSSWGFGTRLSDISGGALYFNINYLELRLPNGAIGMEVLTGSAALMVFSVDPSTGNLQDSVPSDPNVPGSGQLSRFSSVSDHLNLILPPTTVSGDPSSFPSVIPFFWDWQTGGDPEGDDVHAPNPWAGYNLHIALDPDYDPLIETIIKTSSDYYFAMNAATGIDDIVGDNLYYWRVQPRYLTASGAFFGAWTGGWSFERIGYTPQNLQTSITFATPTFTWDLADGAGAYDLQVSTDPSFTSLAINVTTPQNTFTPQNTLPEDDYYWHVRIRRYGNITNDWSPTQQFSLHLPTPTGLTPDDPFGLNPVNYAPTFCWDPLIGYSSGVPVLTAWKYRIQVSTDPNFSSIYDSRDTEMNCWTPTKGYNDGTYYWRAAMIDGNGRVGTYSANAMFTKQYPITTLISPIGGMVPYTPTFIWTPVNGAATYRLEVSQNPTFSPLYDSIDTVNTHFTPTKLYVIDLTYYWRVAIRDADGRQGPFTDAEIIVGDTYFVRIPIVSK